MGFRCHGEEGKFAVTLFYTDEGDVESWAVTCGVCGKSREFTPCAANLDGATLMNRVMAELSCRAHDALNVAEAVH